MKIKKIALLHLTSETLKEVKHPVHYYPPLPLKYIESMLLQDGLGQVRHFDSRIGYHSHADMAAAIVDHRPDLAVLLANFISPGSALDLVRRIKEGTPEVFVIAIGPVASWNMEELLSEGSQVDGVIPGEAEMEVCSIIKSFSSPDKIRRLCRDKYGKEGSVVVVEDLDRLPFMKFTRDDLRDYRLIYPVRVAGKVRCGYMETSRGCAHGCVFCSQYIRKSFDKKIRLKDPKRVVDEMEALLNNGANFISFEDDDFTSSREHASSVCNEIIKRKLKVGWTAEARVDESDAELLALMRRAGCDLLQFGVESGSEKIIGILRKTHSPERWLRTCRDAFASSKKAGIATCALFLVGSPTENEEDIKKSMDFAASLAPDLIKLHFFCVYPGSSAETVYKDALAGSDKAARVYHHDYPSINLSAMSTGRLIEAREEFYRRILMNPRFIYNHFRKYALYDLFNSGNMIFLVSKTLRLLSRGGKP